MIHAIKLANLWIHVAIVMLGGGQKIKEIKSIQPCPHAHHCTVTLYRTEITYPNG